MTVTMKKKKCQLNIRETSEGKDSVGHFLFIYGKIIGKINYFAGTHQHHPGQIHLEKPNKDFAIRKKCSKKLYVNIVKTRESHQLR